MVFSRQALDDLVSYTSGWCILELEHGFRQVPEIGPGLDEHTRSVLQHSSNLRITAKSHPLLSPFADIVHAAMRWYELPALAVSGQPNSLIMTADQAVHTVFILVVLPDCGGELIGKPDILRYSNQSDYQLRSETRRR